MHWTSRNRAKICKFCKKFVNSQSEEITQRLKKIIIIIIIIEIFVDLENTNYPCTSDLFVTLRPDLLVKIGEKVIVIELTVCFDTNTLKSRAYKENRYNKLKEELRIPCSSFEILYVEFTTLGFISKVSYKPLHKFFETLGINQDRTFSKCMETAIRATYYVFCRRNKSWEVSDLLNFY